MVDPWAIIVWANLIAGFSFVFPALLNFKYYRQLRLVEYLYVAVLSVGYFLVLFLYALTVEQLYEIGGLLPRILGSTEFFLDIGLLLLIYRFKWEKTPTIMYLPLVVMAGLGIWSIVDAGLYFGFFPVAQVGWTALIIIRCSIALYVLLTTTYPNEARRLRFSRGLWIYGTGIGNILTQIIVVVTAYIPQVDIVEIPLWLLITALGFTVLAYASFLVNHIFFPEAVLLSSTVLGRATDLYSNVTSVGGRGLQSLGMPTIKEYLESLPEEYLTIQKEAKS